MFVINKIKIIYHNTTTKKKQASEDIACPPIRYILPIDVIMILVFRSKIINDIFHD